MQKKVIIDTTPQKEKINAMFSEIAKHYNIMNDLMTFGFHRLWKIKLVKNIPFHHEGPMVDLCTGTGDIAFLSHKYNRTNKLIYALDSNERMLLEARKKLKRMNTPNIIFKLSDVQDIPFDDNSFSAVTLSFGIRNVEQPLQLLKEIKRVLKSGGLFLCLEATKHSSTQNSFISFLQYFYMKTIIPNLGKLLIKKKEAYEYLPHSVDRFWGHEDFLFELQRNGFNIIRTEFFLFKSATLYICKRVEN